MSHVARDLRRIIGAEERWDWQPRVGLRNVGVPLVPYDVFLHNHLTLM